MRTNHDEKIIEHIMESRNTGLSDKIMKWQKLLNFGTQAPVQPFSFFTTLKSYAHAQTMLLLKFAQYRKMVGTKETPIKCTWNCTRFEFPNTRRIYKRKHFKVLSFFLGHPV